MQETPYTVIYIKNFTHKLQVLHIQFSLFFLLDKPVQMQLKKIAGCITCDSHFALRSQKKKEKKKSSEPPTNSNFMDIFSTRFYLDLNELLVTHNVNDKHHIPVITHSNCESYFWLTGTERSLIKVKQCILMCRNFPFFCSKVKHLFHLVCAVMLTHFSASTRRATRKRMLRHLM